MRLLLLNQFGGDSGAPTGRILAELAAELERRGHRVFLLAPDAGYGKPSRGWMRILREARSHLLMLAQSFRYRKIDAVISLSSPACLAVTAGGIARLHRARHFHWAMDLYPEVGARLGELKSKTLVRILAALMRRAYREAAQIIVLDEDMREHILHTYGVDSVVIEPFPPEVDWQSGSANGAAKKQWLYSGNFGRAHEIEVLLQVQKKLEEREVNAELVLQGHGPQFISSREAANRLGLRRIQWRAPVALEELGTSLLESDVLVVTRKADMKGLLLPSKLMLAELSGRSILWIGDTDGKTARRLAQENRHGVFAIDGVEPIAAWLQQVFERKAGAVVPPRPTTVARQQSVQRWEALLS